MHPAYGEAAGPTSGINCALLLREKKKKPQDRIRVLEIENANEFKANALLCPTTNHFAPLFARPPGMSNYSTCLSYTFNLFRINAFAKRGRAETGIKCKNS